MQSGFWSHISRRHALVGRHTARLARRHLRVVVFGRVDGVVAIDAVGVARRGLGSVQTSLQRVSKEGELAPWRVENSPG